MDFSVTSNHVMEINVETAVRICPINSHTEALCIQPNLYNNTIVLDNSQVYPVNYALPLDCDQNALFATTVSPLLPYFFEGCDISVVTVGQSKSGKTYTLLGPELNCTLSESEYGIIPRFLREIFNVTIKNLEVKYLVHVTWTQIFGDNLRDLLGSGTVECNNISDAFDALQLGMENLNGQGVHTLFTVTVEQQWHTDSAVRHRVSTASFIDLSNCEKMVIMDNNGYMQSIPIDSGLFSLQKCVWALSDDIASEVPYDQSALTLLLRDSFGGRAKTLLICCVSPILGEYMETLYTLQFAARAQMVKNLVSINGYTTYESVPENTDIFCLEFATSQLFKLVSNAESLFKNLIVSSSLTKSQMDQIAQWLMLKQECEDCISESSVNHRSLEIIEEEGEDSCASDLESETADDDCVSSMDGLSELMGTFQLKTDQLVSNINRDRNVSRNSNKGSATNSSTNEFHVKGARGRRGSIHSAEEYLAQVSVTSKNIDVKNSDDNGHTKQKILKQIKSEISDYDKQIREIELTIQMKEKLMQQLLKHKNMKKSAGDKVKQKYEKLQNDQHLVRSRLLQAKLENNRGMEHKYNLEISDIEQKLHNTELVKNIAQDGNKKILELEGSLNTSKRQLEKLKKHKRKEEKRRITIENDLRIKRPHEVPAMIQTTNNRNTYIINKFIKYAVSTESPESVRHEIKNLRKARDFLLEQKYQMNIKSHHKEILNELQEYKVFQCEEALEAIDLTIEYKNQIICGHAVLNVEKHDDPVDRILTEQFLKLDLNEIRVILQKYFEKVIDIRGCGKKLEQQIIRLESQNEDYQCRIQNLSQALQRIRLESERNMLSLQQQHEDKLQIVLRHMSNDGAVSHVVERSKQTALALQVAQGAAKHIDKGSLIARFTRYARQETIPRQLQAATAPQAKVTIQKNKLIIQQSSK